MNSSGGMYSGTVRNWFDSSQARGYGFIIPDIQGEDVFVHRQHIMHATYLTAGDTVTYELQVNQRKDKNKLQVVKVGLWCLFLAIRLQGETTRHNLVRVGLQGQVGGPQVGPIGRRLGNRKSGTVPRLADLTGYQKGWSQSGKAWHLIQSLILQVRIV